ncbi:MAG: PhoX family phosphatase [Gammaproteobacteria bacterium]
MIPPIGKRSGSSRIRKKDTAAGSDTEARTFASILDERISRRTFLKSAAWIVPVSTLPAWIPLTGCAPTGGPTEPQPDDALTFRPIPGSQDDRVVLPSDYRYDVVLRWGDSLWSDTPDLDTGAVPGGSLLKAGEATAQARQFGYNCDAIQFFPLSDGGRNAGLLCVNHEFTTGWMMFPGWGEAMHGDQITADYVLAHPETVRYGKAAHGISVVEVEQRNGHWRFVKDSRYNRRITADTPIDISGPARGTETMRTASDPLGERVLGTLGNCGGGKTPWGTYLSAEEYIDYYFGNYQGYLDKPTGDPRLGAIHRRLPLHDESSFYDWHLIDDRFDVARHPAEACRFGWIVEVDPYDPESVPKKRTALGRMKHEAATCHLAIGGQAVVYTGDDEAFEYVYKFVSRGRYDPDQRERNMNLLDSGTLYVARFDGDGTGKWLALDVKSQPQLNPGEGFASQADVLVATRRAADLLGATPMDRPEDLGVSPVTGHVYVVCTKNKTRTSTDAANPRPDNLWGHIIEIVEDDNDHAGTSFHWEPILLAGDPKAGSGRLLTSLDDLRPGELSRDDTYFAGFGEASLLAPLGAPDNIGFDPAGNLWIVTDGVQPRGTNNGAFVCPCAGPTRGYLRQFMSAPKDAEVCGCEFTPEGDTLFLSVQHPGDEGSVTSPNSDWPDGHGNLPRPSVIAITRKKGNPTIGS